MAAIMTKPNVIELDGRGRGPKHAGPFKIATDQFPNWQRAENRGAIFDQFEHSDQRERKPGDNECTEGFADIRQTSDRAAEGEIRVSTHQV